MHSLLLLLLLPSVSSLILPTTLPSTLLALKEATEPELAKKTFYFLFFAGSGGLTIGGNQIPKILADNKQLQSLANDGDGGEDLPLNGVASAFYPSPLSSTDLTAAIAAVPSSAVLSDANENPSYMCQNGYIDRSTFVTVLTELNCNPLASYAVFEAVKGGSSRAVPGVALEEKLANWRGPDGLEQFVSDLTKAKTVKLGSYVSLALLLALVVDLIGESFVQGFM